MIEADIFITPSVSEGPYLAYASGYDSLSENI